ncbi:MAG: glucose-6-phosphate isomerase [Ignavibacteria bacterium]|nr:glucose-6-phosphate isomerase [Ignavibacteria bacterium]
MVRISEIPSWLKLVEHHSKISKLNLNEIFGSNRIEKLIFEEENILVDFSKNHITEETLELLVSLAKELQLEKKIEMMFAGERINFTESRPALHIALRNLSNYPIKVDGVNVMPKVNAVLLKMKLFTESIQDGTWCGFDGERITDIVHIGIGGSDLGPRLICDALEEYRNKNLKVHFVSNVDGLDIHATLKCLNPKTTLFIIASKSFTTPETLINANTAKEWFLKHTGANENAIAKHFVAISTNEEACFKFGIPKENMFTFWDWVGGRFSLWSSIGLVISLYLGFDNFTKLLAGAHKIDTHFRSTTFEKNLPILLALLTIWYNNFWNYLTYAIIPYDLRLRLLPDYLQQLIMESNGKRINSEGKVIDYCSSPIVWGRIGTDSQHSFFQLLHQGTQIVPLIFVGVAKPSHNLSHHHDVLIANMIAQSEALMCGKSSNEVYDELSQRNLTREEIEKILPHKIFPGNRPSTTIFLRELNPETLGSLLAIFEHKVFVEGTIWDINPFDQWGVELGKELAKKVLNQIEAGKVDENQNLSTQKLLLYYLKNKENL